MTIGELHKVVYSDLMYGSRKDEFKKILNKLGSSLKSDFELDKTLNINKKVAILTYNGLLKTKVFTLNSNNIVELLKNTNNKVYNRKLPFDNIFIECELRVKNVIFYGFHLLQDEFGISVKLLFSSDKMPKGFTFRGVLNNMFKNNFRYDLIEDKEIKNYITEINKESDKLLKGVKKEVAIFICNFLDFLNNPDIELITIERTEEQNKKRLLRGKPPIPIIKNVRITGKLKIYLDKLNSGAHFSYSHRFWVRGHFRTLRSEKWINKRGTKMWILPFIKGHGVLVNKIYEVKK